MNTLSNRKDLITHSTMQGLCLDNNERQVFTGDNPYQLCWRSRHRRVHAVVGTIRLVQAPPGTG